MQGFVTDAITHIGGEALGHGAPGALVRAAAVQLVGGLAHQQPGGGQLGGHVGEAKLHALEFGDGAAKLLALLHMGQRIVQRLLGCAHRAAGDVDAATVEGLHGEPEPFPLLPQAITGGDAHPVEGHLPGRLAVPAHLLLRLAVVDPRRVGGHHKG
ncbi:hypothetical protein D3C84_907730 [compost metagenome]